MNLRLIFVGALVGLAISAPAKPWYVDAAAGGARNGTNWANAWTNMDAISGLSAGDVVYISGGPSGSSRTYKVNSLGTNWPGIWIPASGAQGNPITYTIGQDSAHNGTAIFLGSGDYSGGGYWLGYQTTPRPHDIIISGDAGDGQMHFATTNYASVGIGMNYSNVRISYVNFGRIGSGIDFNPASGLEFDHNYVFISDPAADHFSSATLNGTAWGQNSIHDCTIYVPAGTSGIGADCLQWNGAGGFDIYNNFISGYATNYVGGQHMDGWQGQGGTYIRIYGNTVANFGDYALYGDDTCGGFTNLWIYNNIVINCGGGVIVGVDGGAPATNYFVDVRLANNLVDSGANASGQSMALGNATTRTASFTDCLIANNIIVGGEPYYTPGNSTTPLVDNSTLTPSQAASLFVRYVPNSVSSDVHLVATASSLIGKGTNLYSFFTADKDGNARQSAGAWDVGVYTYLGKPGAPIGLRSLTP